MVCIETSIRRPLLFMDFSFPTHFLKTKTVYLGGFFLKFWPLYCYYSRAVNNQGHVMMAQIQYLNIVPDKFLLKCINVQGRSLHTLCSLVRRYNVAGLMECNPKIAAFEPNPTKGDSKKICFK